MSCIHIYKMFRRAYDLHQLAIQLIENEKPGIYRSDPIPHPKFEKKDDFVLCPYCSTSHKSSTYNANGKYNIKYYYVNQREFDEHIISKKHVKEFVKHHMMENATDDLINKVTYTLTHHYFTSKNEPQEDNG